ncbi:hypothetical protein FIBSPDRAFT_850790 [Athelia psychrophila]|uniref:Uncharacterized protein n=1 Tax=Athelia psychrophila TaxID=1759441 RepID=A0A166T1J9_9AGAM|nr:hypothetical protein FIBSPDRAFT_850790 [Fibularhizoctonia sp. CBS 109695]
MLIPAAETNPPAAAQAPALTHTPNHDDFSRQLSNRTWQPPDLSEWATPYYLTHAWSMYHATAWHHTRPDTRVTLHPEYLVTLYDPVYTSLAANNRLPRLEHGLVDLSDADQDAFLAELDGAIRAWNGDSNAKVGGASGVDWVAIAQTVVDRTGGTLAELHALLTLTDVPPAPDAAEVVSTARLVVFALLMPYIDHAALFAPGITTAERSSVLADVSKQCRVALTGHIDAPAYQLTPQERRLKHAVEGVLQRICGFSSRVLEEALDLLETSSTDQTAVRRKLAIAEWREGVKDLMGWLGWAMWERCPRMCGWDEQCYIPMWPLDSLDERDSERVPEPLVPRCIKREDFKQ